MKKTISMICLLLVVTITSAQITYEATYPSYDFGIIKLKWSGYKYLTIDTALNLYNLNHTLFRSIPIPPQPLASALKFSYISEGLFNTDSTDIEYLLQGQIGSSGLFSTYYLRVYDQSGAVVFSKDSVSSPYEWPSPTTGAMLKPIFNTDQGTKMLVAHDDFTGFPYSYDIYSLPGSLECISCNTAIAGITAPSDNNGFMTANPNPANGFTQIRYNLPYGEQKGEIAIYNLSGQELKRYPVNNSGYLTLPVGDLPQGSYLYSLQVPGRAPETKKMIVIH